MARSPSNPPTLAPEPRSGERSEHDQGGGANVGGAPSNPPAGSRSVPNSEVLAKARRRSFSARYKLEILDAVEAARETGEIGALLRREGLYSSHLTKWRAQQKNGALRALAPLKRGPKATPPNPLARRVAELEHENRRLERRLAHAEAISEIQKKVSELQGICLDPPPSNERIS